MNVIVVGAGSFGSWSARKLLEAGHQVTLIDSWGPGNSRASSGGETRVIRTVYGQDEIYVEMAKDSMDQWRVFQQDSGEKLMELVGSLWFCGEDDSYIQAAAPKIRSLGLDLQEYDLAEAAQRWPQIRLQGLNKVILEPTSGYLKARLACQTLVELFVRQGGNYLKGAVQAPAIDQPVHELKLQDGQVLSADVIVFACGPWLGTLFPGLIGNQIQVSRQEVYYFGTPDGNTAFDRGNFPIWLELIDPIYYGIPSIDRRGFKVARDERGEDFDPSSSDRTPTLSLVEKARDYIAGRFPALAQAPLIESRVCQYSNTPDGHFLLDRHEPSGLILVGGGSGHGFKMGPSIGDRVRDLVENNTTEPLFGLSRFAGKLTRTTQFDHS